VAQMTSLSPESLTFFFALLALPVLLTRAIPLEAKEEGVLFFNFQSTA